MLCRLQSGQLFKFINFLITVLSSYTAIYTSCVLQIRKPPVFSTDLEVGIPAAYRVQQQHCQNPCAICKGQIPLEIRGRQQLGSDGQELLGSDAGNFRGDNRHDIKQGNVNNIKKKGDFPKMDQRFHPWGERPVQGGDKNQYGP